MEVKGVESIVQGNDSEGKLIFSGKYAILAVHINGYLPLSIVKGKLTIKYTATPFVLQWVFNLFVFINWGFIFFYSEEFGDSFRSFGYTEKLVLNWMGLLATLLCVYFRIRGLWVRKSTLKFWKGNVNLLMAFESTCNPALDKKLSIVHISVRKLFVSMAFVITGFIAILASIPLFQGRLGGVGLSTKLGVFIASLVMNIVFLLHATQGIWLLFFFKFYTSLFSLIESKLGYLHKRFSNASSVSQQVCTVKLESDIKECYELYTKVENQTKEFSNHYRFQLVSECALGICFIVGNLFIHIRLGLSLVNEPGSIVSSIILLTPVAIYWKRLYDLGTEGSQLTSAALGIATQLYDLYNSGGRYLNFQVRQDLHVFAMKIRTQPANVDAAQYFVFNRKLLIAVSLYSCYSTNSLSQEIYFEYNIAFYRYSPQSPHT